MHQPTIPLFALLTLVPHIIANPVPLMTGTRPTVTIIRPQPPLSTGYGTRPPIAPTPLTTAPKKNHQQHEADPEAEAELAYPTEVTVSIVSEVHTVVQPTPVSSRNTNTTPGKHQEREEKIQLNYWESSLPELRAHQSIPLPEKHVRRDAQRLPIPFNSFVSLASQIQTRVRTATTAGPTGGAVGTGGGGGAAPGGGALPTGSVNTPSRKHQGREADPEAWSPVTLKSIATRLGSVVTTAVPKPTPTWSSDTSAKKHQQRDGEDEDSEAKGNILEELLEDPDTTPTTDDTDDFIADLYNVYLAEGDFDEESEPEPVPEPGSLFERQDTGDKYTVAVPTGPVYNGKPTYTEKPTVTMVVPAVPVYTEKPVYSEKPVYTEKPLFTEKPVYSEKLTGKPIHTGKPYAQ